MNKVEVKMDEKTVQYYITSLEDLCRNLQEENEQLQQKVNQLEEDYKNEVEENLKLSELWQKSQEEKRQLETNRDDAIGYIKYCQVNDKDIFPVIEAGKMIEILERGKEL